MITKRYLIFEAKADMRLDRFLESRVDLNRSQIKKIIDSGNVLVDGNYKKSGYKLKDKQKIEIFFKRTKTINPQRVNFDILYSDDDIAVISKPKDLVVHFGNGNHKRTLVDGLIYEFDKLANPMDEDRPGIVHRLDKDTSGLMIISKSDRAYYQLVEDFKNSKIKKTYLAITHGKLDKKGIIEKNIGRSEVDRKKMAIGVKNSKIAITEYKLIEYLNGYSLAKIEIKTGRTHQIRVHMASINHPILGDGTYGIKNDLNVNTQVLHAYELKFLHPVFKNEMTIRDKMPSDFKDILRKLRIRAGKNY